MAEEMKSALEGQVDGDHYKKMKIQPMVYAYENGLPWMEGEIVKYTSRHKSKHKARDLKAAIHLLQTLLQFDYGILSKVEYVEKPKQETR